MNKKNIIVATLALIISACTSPMGVSTFQQSVDAAADKITPANQQAYFACSFERHQTECREKIWKTHPKPELSRGLSRETVPYFLDAVELRGAGLVVASEAHVTCGKPQDVSSMFWERGYDVTCADGKHYIVNRENNQWRVKQAPSEK